MFTAFLWRWEAQSKRLALDNHFLYAAHITEVLGNLTRGALLR